MSRRLALVLGALALLGALLPVLTPASSSPTAISAFTEADPVVAGTARAVAGSPYRFATVLSGKPVRWNPCAPIHWQFRAAGAPKNGRAVVNAAVARIAKVTGTRWVFDGVVRSAPSTAWLPRSTSGIRPVLIGWTDAAHSDLLRGKPARVLGVTRTAWFGWRSNGVSVGSIRAAVIALDRTDRLPSNGPVSWKTVLLHELTHAMGLDHAGSSRELMYPVLQYGLRDLQPGDLQGLTKVGRRAGCVKL
ncbi:MAG: peptidase and matrixin and adamalysin [Frankiales bacterium]|nr:peptidase and matrixin and adamalysin [Frankiales bacterium]